MSSDQLLHHRTADVLRYNYIICLILCAFA